MEEGEVVDLEGNLLVEGESEGKDERLVILVV